MRSKKTAHGLQVEDAACESLRKALEILGPDPKYSKATSEILRAYETLQARKRLRGTL